MDAYNGQVKFYTISKDPIVSVWAGIYPGLFVDGGKMPPAIRSQLTYPSQLFHIQFDDVFVFFTMKDPLTFFTLEDLWDDGDEVVGPILDSGEAITFSIEPYSWIVETGGLLPEAEPRVQYALSMVFTPEGVWNLRAIPIVYQDGKDYGRIVVLQVPKGHFVTGPEQADSMIDQSPEISRQLNWWNRLGSEVIRGHTTTLVVDNEVIYVEPIFLRSKQNPVTQLKRVAVVLRGEVAMGKTFAEALRLVVDKARAAQNHSGVQAAGDGVAPNRVTHRGK